MQDPSAFGMMMGLGGVVEEEHEKVRCPRCSSDNTKFCYYNNYNMSQPRHYCKACRRYWTKGGALRNIPVGGSSRNSNKRSSSSSSSSASSSKRASSSSSSSSSSSHTGGSGNNHQLGSTDHRPPNGMLSVGPIQNGNMPTWSPPPTATGNTTTNVCPDLAIYTPHSTFQ